MFRPIAARQRILILRVIDVPPGRSLGTDTTLVPCASLEYYVLKSPHRVRKTRRRWPRLF